MSSYSLLLLSARLLLMDATEFLHGSDRAVGSPSVRQDLDSARAALATGDIQSAERHLRGVVVRDTATGNRAYAERELGRIAWRYHRSFSLGRSRLRNAEALPAPTLPTLLERVRLETAAGDFDSAFAAGQRALAAAISPAARRNAATALTLAATEPFIRWAQDRSRVDWPGRRGLQRVDTAMATLGPLVDSSPGYLEPSRQLLRAALIARDGAAAVRAWQSYFLSGTGGTHQGPLARSRALLESTIGRGVWGSRDSVVEALVASRLYPEAALAIRDPRETSQTVSTTRSAEILAYATFLRRVTQRTEDYYAALATGAHGPGAVEWHAALEAEARRLWLALIGTDHPRPYSTDAFTAEISKRFGAEPDSGRTGEVEDLHFGHRIQDVDRTVVQYGHRANVRLLVLDEMVSNGYETWVWDGRGAHGGWNRGSQVILQVRASYAQEPLNAWRQTTDSILIARQEDGISADSTRDWDRALADSVAHLPGVAARLLRDGRRQLADSLRASGREGRALQIAFVEEYARLRTESSIFNHEGRHVLDEVLLGDSTAEEFEFRAKLSEIAFSERPRLAFDGIFSVSTGQPTPHGKANTRIMLGIIAWMRAHQDDIPGLDVRRPILPQFPLLSDNQIRAVFRAMDPLAAGADERTS